MRSDWLERHRRSVLLAVGLLIACGLLSVWRLPVGLFPRVDFPRIVLSIEAGDRPVDRMVVEITRPLELALRRVPDIRSVRSTSTRGSAELSMSFDWGSDMVVALLQAQSVVAETARDLPADVRFDLRRMDPTVFPVLGLSLTSDHRDLVSLRDLATYQLTPELSSVEGVAQIEILGGHRAEFQISLDPARMRSLGMTPQDVSAALAASNQTAAVGRLEDRYLLYLALTDNRLEDLDSIRDVVLRSTGGVPVRLRDVGKVTLSVTPEWTRVNADGHDAVLINVKQQRGANTIAIVQDIQKRLGALQQRLPSDVTITPYYDQSELISASAGSVRDAILIGAALAGVILLLFLRNVRMTLIVAVVMPAVLIATCVLLFMLGQSLNIMTLGGMAAAVGLVVDDAVVVIEHVARRLVEAPEKRRSPSAVIQYALEMLRPLAGSSAATVAVFVPLSFLGGVAGSFFRPLALTMAAALSISFLFALLVVPLLTSRLVRERDAEALEHQGRFFDAVQRRCANALQRLLLRPILLLPVLLVLLAAGYASFSRLGSGFMPHMDEGGFIFDYRASPGTSLTETDRLMRQVEAIVQSLPEVDSYSRRTGVQLGGGLTEANEGDMFIRLKPPPRRDIESVMADLRSRVESQVPGLTVETAQLMEDLIGDLIANPQPVEIKVFGGNIDGIREQARRIAGAIEKIPGIVEVDNGTRIAGDAISIRVNPLLAARDGLSVEAVRAQLSRLLEGETATEVQLGEKLVGIRVWSPSNLRQRVEQLRDLPLFGSDGQSLKLSRLAEVSILHGQAQLDRDALRDTVRVTARLEGRDLGSAMTEVKRVIASLKLPAGYGVEYGGLYKEQQRSFQELTIVFIGALLLVATILMALYERVAVVASILLTSLLSLTGVFIGLYVTGSELDLSSMMGMTMVLGISAEVAVFYFAEINTGSAIHHDDLVRAAKMRLRPILMTTLIAILALSPLALGLGTGSAMQRPLAITIIAGLLLAVPLVLLAMPVMFQAFDRVSGRRGQEDLS